MALEHLREQRLAIGDKTLGRLAGAHPVREGEAQIFFEVPPETRFFRIAKRVGDGDRLGRPVVEAQRGVRLVSEAARFRDRHQAHRSGPLTTSNWVPGACCITTISKAGFCSVVKNVCSSSLLIKSVTTPVAMVVATPPRKIKTVPGSIG